MTGSKLYDDVHTAVIDAGLRTHEALTPDPELIQFIEQSELNPGARVLDVGCGCGRNAVFLAKEGFAVTAIDVSHSAIQLTQGLAQEYGVVVNTMTLDVCRPDVLPKGTFELVIDARCLHNIVATDMRKNFLSNLCQSLVSGGWYFGINIGRPDEKSAREINVDNGSTQFVNINDIKYQPIILNTKNGNREYLVRVSSPIAGMWPASYENELAEAGFVDIRVDFSFEKGRRPLPNRLLATARKPDRHSQQ